MNQDHLLVVFRVSDSLPNLWQAHVPLKEEVLGQQIQDRIESKAQMRLVLS